MRLWLLRHGEAQIYAPSDELRELTDRGMMEVNAAAARLLAEPLDGVLVSPYRRAQQTAALVCRALDFEDPLTVPWLTPDTEVAKTLKGLDGFSGNWLVVAHQPLLGDLAGMLVHGHRQQPLPFRTGQLVGLEGDDWVPGLMLPL